MHEKHKIYLILLTVLNIVCLDHKYSIKERVKDLIYTAKDIDLNKITSDLYIRFLLRKKIITDDNFFELYESLIPLKKDKNKRYLFNRFLYLRQKRFTLCKLAWHFTTIYDRIKKQIGINIDSYNYTKVKYIYEEQLKYNDRVMNELNIMMKTIKNLVDQNFNSYIEKALRLFTDDFFSRKSLMNVVFNKYNAFLQDLIKIYKNHDCIKLKPFNIYEATELAKLIYKIEFIKYDDLNEILIALFLERLSSLLGLIYMDEKCNIEISKIYKYEEKQSSIIRECLKNQNVSLKDINNICQIVSKFYLEL